MAHHRMGSGWALAMMDKALNFDERPRRRTDEWIERFDECKVGDAPDLISTSSCIKDRDPYIVFIMRLEGERYAVRAWAKNYVFGMSASFDSLDEAVACYDAYRGKRHEAVTLF